MVRRILSSACALALAASALVAGAAPAAAQVEMEVVAEGLNNPRGLAWADGSLYIAEAGATGDTCVNPDPQDPEFEVCGGLTSNITVVTGDTVEQLVDGGLPSLGAEGEATGAQDVIVDDAGNVAATVGLGGDLEARAAFGDDFSLLGHLVEIENGAATSVADLLQFEADNDPDASEPGSEGVDSNPYSLVEDDAGYFATDAGGNTLLSVTSGGAIEVEAVFPFVTVPAPEGIPGLPPEIPMQPVPTAVVRGPDDALYVAQLTGFPFPPGGASVWRIEEGGEPEVFATGFTTIMDLAWRGDDLFVLQLTRGGLLGEPTPGALIRVRPNGSHQLVASDGLVTPAGLTVDDDGMLYVSNNGLAPGAGTVVRIDPSQAGDAALASACPPDSVPGAPFTDILGETHEEAIHCLQWWGVVQGFTDGTFGPGQGLTRGQFASMLYRTLGEVGADLPQDPPDAFNDDNGSVHEEALNALAALNVVQGVSPGVSAAGSLLTRGQAASLLARTYQAVAEEPLPAGTDAFTDDDGNTHEAAINSAAAAGWLQGYGDGTFRPGQYLTRGQMSSVTARMLATLVDEGIATLPSS